MINPAGRSYDFDSVLFAVLQECEHRRRSFLPAEAEQQILSLAGKKLDDIEPAYREAGGNSAYWQQLKREVLETVIPQYIPRAIEQSRLEKTNYDLWRQGDLLARVLMALAGLTVGGLIIQAPFIPIFWKPFAFLVAAGCWFYPEMKRLTSDYRHSRLLNRLISASDRYQKNSRLHYLNDAHLEELFRAVDAQPEPSASDDALERNRREAAKAESEKSAR